MFNSCMTVEERLVKYALRVKGECFPGILHYETQKSCPLKTSIFPGHGHQKLNLPQTVNKQIIKKKEKVHQTSGNVENLKLLCDLRYFSLWSHFACVSPHSTCHCCVSLRNAWDFCLFFTSTSSREQKHSALAPRPTLCTLSWLFSPVEWWFGSGAGRWGCPSETPRAGRSTKP